MDTPRGPGHLVSITTLWLDSVQLTKGRVLLPLPRRGHFNFNLLKFFKYCLFDSGLKPIIKLRVFLFKELNPVVVIIRKPLYRLLTILSTPYFLRERSVPRIWPWLRYLLGHFCLARRHLQHNIQRYP